jgi:outer membrane protein OmpA-like peptidoglycan-associated protein
MDLYIAYRYLYSVNRVILSVFLLFICVVGKAQQDEMRKSIYFGGGSYYVDDYQIQELYYWLDSIPNLLEKYEIQLISHTDPIGGKEYNAWLSKMRGEAVEELLLQREIPDARITIKSERHQTPVHTPAAGTRQGPRARAQPPTGPQPLPINAAT